MKTNQTTEKKLKKVLRGEIYYADLPAESCGAELRGMHPVLIVQNDVGNRFSTTTIVLPITTDRRTKKPMPRLYRLLGARVHRPGRTNARHRQSPPAQLAGQHR